MHQQRVAGDIERQAEEHVARALIELAGELAVGDIELEERMARRQRHFVQFADVPGRDDNPTRVRIVFQLFHHRANLVDVTAVRRGPGTPLLAINRTQVAVFIRPFIPDSDVVFVQTVPVPVRSFFCVPSSSTFCIKSRYCFMVPQEFCCCGRERYAQTIIMIPASTIGIERICPMLMYCTQPPVNCASGWRKNSTMMRNKP